MAINRRDFMLQTAAAGAGAMLTTFGQSPTSLAAQGAAATAPLDIAEWSFFWVGVERAELARGTVVNGKQMYVEYQIPAQVRHPYPIVLIHGGGGQGLDWLLTPDGRPGWAASNGDSSGRSSARSYAPPEKAPLNQAGQRSPAMLTE